ncbi:MAG: AraC family transcriptional regulator ligand-binding domain-containing protein [Spongiibacteraceae bacterium]
MGTEELIIPRHYITTLLKEVEEHGYAADRLLSDAGIDRRSLDDNLYHSAQNYGRLYKQAMRVMHDEWFGMISGGKIGRGSFRLMSLLMVNSKTLRHALLRAADFSQVCRGFRLSIEVEEICSVARVRLAPVYGVNQDEFRNIIQDAKPVILHTTIAAWQRHWSWLIGSEIAISKTMFTFDKPEHDWEMAQFSSREIIFNSTFNGIEFPRSYLDYSVIQNEETLDRFLRSSPFGLIINEGSRGSTKARVKALLNQNVGHSMIGADDAAKRLNMSVTTLRRHLQLEGTSFQKLKDECRMEAAFHYLGCPDLSNRVIAEKLGFDEVSTFFRAFKKWTGTTPGEHRLLECRAVKVDAH